MKDKDIKVDAAWKITYDQMKDKDIKVFAAWKIRYDQMKDKGIKVFAAWKAWGPRLEQITWTGGGGGNDLL